jgi:hypothetical protein
MKLAISELTEAEHDLRNEMIADDTPAEVKVRLVSVLSNVTTAKKHILHLMGDNK